MKTLQLLLVIAVGVQTLESTKAHDLTSEEGVVPAWYNAPQGVVHSSSTIVSGDSASCAKGVRMAESFSPFKPKVRYHWDTHYFYEESDGLPDTYLMPNLMVGITDWQQQIPLPTSYFAGTLNPEGNQGSRGYRQPNLWKLPLIPIPAGVNSIPISAGNFQRGAIALAVNGIPIFNPRNNRGADSYAIGELDQYGGHCGLADDYHYHIVPVHLQSVLGTEKPLAWALDGYPIFGYTEPDGTPRQALDPDGGHDTGTDWGYHYHAIGSTATGPQSPYMMSAFHGTVVNFGGQVDPQPGAQPLRASGTGGYFAQPLTGASIIAFKNPVSLATNSSGDLVEELSGTPSSDQYLLRYKVGAATYDICWRFNRNANPKTLTLTWRLPNSNAQTTLYSSTNNRITAYPMADNRLVNLPDTGQTLQVNTAFGEDSDYTLHPPSFTDNQNGTIADNVTGLIWQKTDSGEMTWETALLHAASLTTGGYTDWRLPTPSEAFGLLNHSSKPALNPAYFDSASGGSPEYLWTSDIYGSDATKVWVSNLGGGLGPHPKAETLSAGGTHRFHARYVRGSKASNGHSYHNHCDGTLTDLDTQLMWTQMPSSSLSWTSALAYAEGLTLGNYHDWRLPNVKELQTLVDYTLATATTTNGLLPCLNRTLFPNAPATAYWTSTSVQTAAPSQAWLVEFGINNAVPATSGPSRTAQGVISYEAYSANYPVFAVRSVTSKTIQPSITQGRATTITPNLYLKGQRVAGVGTVTATDGTLWTVPSATQFANGIKASDLYNEATGVRPATINDTDLSSVPIVEIDADGELITGYLFADNYFELYVNGTLVGVDPVPYTAFNSCVVRFRAKRPITYAVKLVDWEENLGLGTELNGGNLFHPGDGGFMASFSDGTRTDAHWKAQSFYISPLDNPQLVIEMPDGTHLSSSASLTPTFGANSFALHYPVPLDWFAKNFNDAAWPLATTYSETVVGADNKPAYQNFPNQFSNSGAQFIWSSNLVLDNEIIVRYTGPAPSTQISVEYPTGTSLSDGVSKVKMGRIGVGLDLLKTFTIRNKGANPLLLSGATIEGEGAGNFTLLEFPVGSVAPGDSTTVSVKFQAPRSGTFTATLHIVSSDTSVGAAFDLGLEGVAFLLPPTITHLTTSPNTPTFIDTVIVLAQLKSTTETPSNQVQLVYNSGGQTTGIVFTETMANAAVTGWTGTGANNLWTVTSLGTPNTLRQTVAANHGTGNPYGLEFDKGTSQLIDSMITTANVIDASGTSGTVEFWVSAMDMISPNGWTFQTSIDGGNTWSTRLSELTGSNHAFQLFHYDLTTFERVSTLKLRFQFAGYNAVAPIRAPKLYLDDIRVSTTHGESPVIVTMVDDGLHGDGLAGDGIYGAEIPQLPAGTQVNYQVTATDANAGESVSVMGQSYQVSSITPSPYLKIDASISSGDLRLNWDAQAGLIYSVLGSQDLKSWTPLFVGQTNRWTDSLVVVSMPFRFYRVTR